jgi:putative component of toxin-antitoxin plasmid stabilization module
MIILRYRTFNDSESFVKWQESLNDEIVVTQVQPILLKMNMTQQTDKKLGGGEQSVLDADVSPYGIFVVFYIR